MPEHWTVALQQLTPARDRAPIALLVERLPDERRATFGDNLFASIDTSAANLPAGAELARGGWPGEVCPQTRGL